MISGSCGRARSQRAPLAATSTPPMCGLRWRQHCGARTARVSCRRCRPRPSSTLLRFSRRREHHVSTKFNHRRCGHRLLLLPLQPQGVLLLLLLLLLAVAAVVRRRRALARERGTQREELQRQTVQSSSPHASNETPWWAHSRGGRGCSGFIHVSLTAAAAAKGRHRWRHIRQPASSAAPSRASTAAAAPHD